MKNLMLLLVLSVPFLCAGQNSCGQAQPITEGTFTTGAIDGVNVTDGCWDGGFQEGEHAEWYRYTPEQNGMLRLNTIFAVNDGITNSNNIHVSIYTGSCGNLQCYTADGEVFPGESHYINYAFAVQTGTDYYIAFDDYASSKKLTFELSLEVAACDTTLPFSEQWLTNLDFTCWKTYSYIPGRQWFYYDIANYDSNLDDDPVAVSHSFSQAPSGPKNEWLISGGIAMQQGMSYTVSIKYNAMQYGSVPIAESFRALVLNGDNPQASQQSFLGEVTGIVQQGAHVEPYNMDLATTVSYQFSPAASGDYHLAIHANAPQSSSMLIIYEVNVSQGVLSNDEFVQDTLLAYPNPASGSVTVSGTDIAGIDLIDANGRVVFSQNYNNATTASLDVSALQSGIYVMKVATPAGTLIKKLIKN